MDDAGSSGEKEKKKRSWHAKRDAERAAQRKVREAEQEEKRLEKEREAKQKVRQQRADEVRQAKEERSRMHSAGLGHNKEVRPLQLFHHQPCL